MVKQRDEDWLERLDRRILAWLWRQDRPLAGPPAWLNMAGQVLYLALRNAFISRLPFEANALTFITLLGLVPALAISFSVAKGLGFSRSLRELLIDSEFVAGQQQVFAQILEYVDRTNVGALGMLGVLLLLVTLVLTLSSVEQTLNRIWEVSVQRSWFRRFTDYLSVLIVCPMLVVAGTGVWAAFSSHNLVRWMSDLAVVGPVAEWGVGLGPIAMVAVAFAFFYIFLPNTKVPMLPGVVAGVVTSLLWWGVQSLYINFQIGVARYNAIYGGFATLPLFMVWLQVSWQVVLFGAQLARSLHVCTKGPLPRAVSPAWSPARREELGLRLMRLVAIRFDQGLEPLGSRELADALGAPPRELSRLAARLEDSGLLSRAGAGLQPARSLGRISLNQVMEAIRGAQPENESDPMVGRVLEQVCGAGQQALEGMSLADMIEEPGDEPSLRLGT